MHAVGHVLNRVVRMLSLERERKAIVYVYVIDDMGIHCFNNIQPKINISSHYLYG